jgi:hypothetical protein
LSSIAAKNPATAEVCVEHLTGWGLRLSLLGVDADQSHLMHIDPTVASLIQRYEARA